MIPTMRGLVVGATGVTLYGLAWGSQIGWFYIADALVWGLLLTNMLFPWLNLRGLSAQRSVIAHKPADKARGADIFEEDLVGFAIRVCNRSLLPSFLVTLEEHCPLAALDTRDQGFFIGSISPRGAITAAYAIRCYQRGLYAFPDVEVESSAPFGLFRARRTIESSLKVTVYPQVLPMDGILTHGALPGGLPESSLPRPSGELRGSREYQPGDQPRNIHWRSSARRGRLMVKEYDEIPQGEVHVAFNPGCVLGQGRDTTLEYSIKIAASLAHRCFQVGRPFRMWPSCEERAFSTWHSVLEYLTRLDSCTETAAQPRPDNLNPSGSSVVVVSAADRPTLQLLRQRRSLSRTVVVLLEGFGPGEDPNANQMLLGTATVVVRCSIGGLPDALGSLCRAMTPAVPILSGASPT